MRSEAKRRHVARTVLLVGEGDSEVVFLRHLKAIYVKRGSGVAVTIKNARGKGAAHVVDVAVRQARNAAFDLKAVLLDTDTDWNEKTRATAKRAKVQVVAAEPCLEALLLAICDHAVEGKTTASLKQDFSRHFGASAFDPTVYERHFSPDSIEKARKRLTLLENLIGLLLFK